MEKWSFAQLQQTCTTAKEKGLLPSSFACGGKGVTKRSLYASLIDKKILTTTGNEMEQISRKLTVYVVVHTTNGKGLQDSAFSMKEFESPAEGLLGTHNLLGSFTSLEKAHKALISFLDNKKKRDPEIVFVRSKIATLDQLKKQFGDADKKQMSYIAADITWKSQTDRFVIHKTVVDREQKDIDDIRNRFERFGLNYKKLLPLKSNYKGVRTSDLVEALKLSLQKSYKRVPVPQFTAYYNPDSDVWYAVMTGIYAGETEKSTSNYIYTVAEKESESIDYAALGLSPVKAETTQYGSTKTPEEITVDLSEISANVIKVT